MKKILVAFVLVSLFTPAFAKHSRKKKKEKASSGIQSVSIERTGCYGRCPVYKITVENTGMVTYKGVMNVADTGIYTKNVGAPAIDIIKKLTENRVDTCRNLYENMAPDLPGLVYTLKYKDSTKMIRNSSWGPVFLRNSAIEIDDVGKEHDSTWKRK